MTEILGHDQVVSEQAFPDDQECESQAVARARRRVERAERKYKAAGAKVVKLRDGGATAERVQAARREMWELHPPLEDARRKYADAQRRSRKGRARSRRR